MRKNVLLFAFLILLVFSAAQVATAGSAWNSNKAPRELNVEDWTSIADTLKLTEEQTVKIQSLQKSHYEKTKVLKSELQDTMFTLKQLRWQKNADQKAVVEKIEKVNELRNKLYEEHQKYHREIESVLTRDQREQLKSICKPKGKSHRYSKTTGSSFSALATT